MLVRLNTSRVTKLTRQPFGSVIDVPDEEAAELIRTHQAVAVESSPAAPRGGQVVETAALAPAAETATRRTPQTRNPRHAPRHS